MCWPSTKPEHTGYLEMNIQTFFFFSFLFKGLPTNRQFYTTINPVNLDYLLPLHYQTMCPHTLSISLCLNFPKGINGGHKAFLCLWQGVERVGKKIRNKNKSGHLPEMRCIRWHFMLLMSLSCISKFSLHPRLSSILAMSETLVEMKSKFLLCTVQTCLCWPR